jgi:hypothetical protein
MEFYALYGTLYIFYLLQAHRKVLGVISLGTCASQIELNELCRLHEAFKGLCHEISFGNFLSLL